jgi:hypothetical protein
MALGYEEMVAFMREYFPAYSDQGQDPTGAHRMYEYYSPDFIFTGYAGLAEPVVYRGADAFVEFDLSHPSSFERLTPEDIAVDERAQVVYALIKFEFIDRATGRVLTEERGMSRYRLVQDQDGSIKIKSLLFFPQRLAPGTLSGVDVFGRDRRRSP